MKIAKLLVLGVLLLVGSGAAKAIDNPWVRPAFPVSSIPEVTEFTTYEEEAEVYLYNEKTRLFFTNGNEWATRASLVFASQGNGGGATAGEAVKGITVMFTRTDACVEIGEGVVELKSNVKNAGTMLSAFAGGVSDVWTDNNGREDRFWKVTPNGSSYRISNVINETDKFLGWNGLDTRLYLLAADAEGVGIDWKMVKPEVYANYEAAVTDDCLAAIKSWQEAVAVYDVAMRLKDVLDQAEAIKANVADQIAIFNNTESTSEVMNQAIADAQAAITAREKEMAQEGLATATVANPADATAYINNPDYAGNSTTGWSQAPSLELHNGIYTAEFYNTTFDMNQELTDLPAGVYTLNLKGFYREGGYSTSGFDKYLNGTDQRNALIYAKEGDTEYTKALMSIYAEASEEGYGNNTEVTVTSSDGKEVHVPNMRESAQIYFDNGRYNVNTLYFGISASPFTIGLKKTVAVGTDWTPFNNWTLNYLGNGADAYQKWLDEALKEFKPIVVEEGTLFTNSYKAAYEAQTAGEKKATNKEEVDAVVGAIKAASDDFNKNLDLWKQFTAVREDARTTGADEALDEYYTAPLADWVEFDSEDILNAMALTNEELEAVIAEKKAEIAEAQKHLKGDVVDIDVTYRLTNPDFSTNDWTGWTREGNLTGNVAVSESCAEAWNTASFDIYQNIEGAPKGVYEISVQGFYRYGRGNNAWNSYQAKEQYTTPSTIPVYIYLNDNTTPFTHVYGDPLQVTELSFYEGTNYTTIDAEDGTKYYFPDGMSSAAAAFATVRDDGTGEKTGMYTQKAYGLVTEDGGQLRIGVKGSSNQLGDSWCIFDNFKLIYKGFAPDVVQPVLETNIDKAKADLTAPIGKDVAEKLQAALQAGQAAIASGDGTAMFDALSALFATNAEVAASKTLFAALATAVEQLATKRSSEAAVNTAAMREADALIAQINNGLDDHTIADADVEGLQKQITVLMSKLGIPDNVNEASDSNPVDVTAAIINPDCTSNEGWEGSPAFDTASRDAEKYNTTYNVFQVINGLPAGTYTVTLTGFYRNGTAQEDYDAYMLDPTTGNHAFIYASGAEGDTCAVAMKRLAAEAKTIDADADAPTDWVKLTGTSLIVPNMMSTASEAFAENRYLGNQVTVKLAEGQPLTIGLKKSTAVTTDWTIWTNWKLTYYGANSTKTVDGDASGILSNIADAVVKTEYFNQNGIRVNKPAKGLYIVRQTLSNGNVVVKTKLFK